MNYKNFIFDHVYISKLIDTVRSGLSNNDFYIIKKDKKFKIMHITNFNERFDGRLHYNTGRRLNNGFIRNGHNVLSISDRDIIIIIKDLKIYLEKNFRGKLLKLLIILNQI